MRIIGLTGSIGMGKSTVAAMFREFGVAVHDSDAAVHRLYQSDAVAPIEAAFPGCSNANGIDRAKLAQRVLGNRDALRQLEAIIHPLVAKDRDVFIQAQITRAAEWSVLDIPLLFETGNQSLIDVILVVSAPFEIQKHRVLQRQGMDEARFEKILAQQIPDAEKRRRAHFCVDTGGNLASTQRQLLQFLKAIGFGLAK